MLPQMIGTMEKTLLREDDVRDVCSGRVRPSRRGMIKTPAALVTSQSHRTNTVQMDSGRPLYDDFGLVYRTYLDVVLAFCVHRIADRELAADLTAEVFAAALIGRGGYSPVRGSVRQWLLGIAAKKVVDAQRRGVVERRAQQQLGMMEPRWVESDLERVEVAGETHAEELLHELPVEQRSAIESRVVGERSYAEIAGSAGVSEQVVRQRVSRGLATIRRRLRTEDKT